MRKEFWLHKRKLGLFLIILLTSIAFLLSLGFTRPTTAQTQSQWSEPANLSQSGSTSNPVMTIDSNQNVHVIWLDAFNDYGYASWDGESWSEPVNRTYIFFPEIPTLLGGANGLVHIFWITDSGALLYSQAPGSDLGNPGSLSPPQVLAGGVLNFHVSTDQQGRIHLGYVQGPNENGVATGIYYRQSEPDGAPWTVPTPVYQSPYYRSITPDNAHVYTAATQDGDNLRVYLTFDNPALKRVFLAASEDGGTTWQEPLEIDAPNSQSVTTTPFDIVVYPDQQNVLLMWKDNLQSSFDCTQLYQFSIDGGASWSQPQTTFDDLVGCPQGNTLFPGPEDSVLLLVDIQESAYIQAWNWEIWSDPQIQGGLNQFTDPVTFSDLRLTDKQAAMGNDNLLFVSGSDRVGNQDTWVTFREIEDISVWYPPPQAWKQPLIVSESTGYLQDPSLLSGTNGLSHLLWTQSPDPEKPMNEWRVFYTQYDGEEWLSPVAILQSPDKYATEVSAALADDRRIFVTWAGHESGDLYFSWSQPDRAYSLFEWAEPQSLPKPPNKASEPEILYNANNNILRVVYTIPINEGRGAYLVESLDEGLTWSEPKLIFDAAAANWTVAEQAYIAQTADGTLHVLLSQKSLPEDSFASALVYFTSSDGGQSWSSPNLVIDQPVVDFNLAAADQLTIHRYWQTDVGIDSRLWHEISLDGGLTWITSTPLSVLGEAGPSAMVLDGLNRAHLLQRYSDISGKQLLQHWEFRGNTWESQENLNENSMISDLAISLKASVGPDGRLVAVSQEQQNENNARTQNNLLFASSRFLDDQIPLVTPIAPVIEPTNTPVPEITPGETPVLIPTTEIQDPLFNPSTPSPTSISFEGMDIARPPSNSISFIIIGVGSAIVIMILLFVVTRLRGK